ncbi:MAG TPA: hypothetical protein VLR26_02145 [Frankiaceae bacterium]|nr:hypothetical protein [Frankiaceae bacterium]
MGVSVGAAGVMPAAPEESALGLSPPVLLGVGPAPGVADPAPVPPPASVVAALPSLEPLLLDPGLLDPGLLDPGLLGPVLLLEPEPLDAEPAPPPTGPDGVVGFAGLLGGTGTVLGCGEEGPLDVGVGVGVAVDVGLAVGLAVGVLVGLAVGLLVGDGDVDWVGDAVGDAVVDGPVLGEALVEGAALAVASPRPTAAGTPTAATRPRATTAPTCVFVRERLRPDLSAAACHVSIRPISRYLPTEQTDLSDSAVQRVTFCSACRNAGRLVS